MKNRTRILIIVFDGLRPDLVTPERMPSLSKFIAIGTRFVNSSCVFPSETRVNSAALGAGSHPSVTGLVANKLYDPAVFDNRIMDTGMLKHVEQAEAVYSGRFVTTTTLGDELANHGLDFVVLSSGSAGATRMANPRATINNQISLCMQDWQTSTPSDFAAEIFERFEPIEKIGFPSSSLIEQQTTMFIEGVFPARCPDVSLIWFNEPDWTPHHRGMGSPEADAALFSLDRQFKRLREWSESDASEGDVQIVAVSDHGHITAHIEIDLKGEFDRAGFEFRPDSEGGSPFVASLGNISTVWLRDGSVRSLHTLVEWLLDQPWCGLVSSKGGDENIGSVPGTFDHALLLNDHARSPDLFFTLSSDQEKNRAGIAGSGFFFADIPEGGSFHGGLNRREMTNLLALGGSKIREKTTCDFPAGIIDVAPTVLNILGLRPSNAMTGRVLHEAFRDGKTPLREPIHRKVTVEAGSKRSIVRVAEFGGAKYVLSGEFEK